MLEQALRPQFGVAKKQIDVCCVNEMMCFLGMDGI